MKNLKQRILLQSGRSMVEVLGVIAIIGVLSICALTFYAYLIDKHHANILSDEILQRSLDIKKQLDNRKRNITLDKFDPQSKLGYTIDYDNVHIGIQVYDVPKRLCDMTLDQVKGVLDSKIYSADGETLLAECEENNTLVFAFEGPQKLSVQKGCPAGTPKNADPDTCECDLTQRYLQEATNECVCWSGEEIDGVCMNFCATSADCDDNEICENHICIKYDNTTTMEPMNTTEVPETTYTTSTTILETSTPETTSASYTTTSQYETTIPETTTFVCPEEKPHYDTDTHTCVECLTDTDCENMAICSADKTCICEITSTDCPASDFVAEQCMCCPSDKPKWNETTKMCEVCPTDKPYYSATQQACIIPTCTDFGLQQGLLATYVRGQDCNTAWRDGFGPFYQVGGAYDWMYIYGSAGNYCKDNAITLIGQLYAPVEGIYTYQLWARPDDDEKNIDQVDVHVDGILQYTVWGVDENNQGRLANTVSLNLKPGLHSFAYWGDQNERGGITLLPVSVPTHTRFCH